MRDFLKKEDISLAWFNKQKYRKSFGSEFVKRAIKFSGKAKLEILREIIKKEMQECMRLEALAKQNVKFENARLQAKAWAELEWVLGEIDKLEKEKNGM